MIAVTEGKGNNDIVLLLMKCDKKAIVKETKADVFACYC